MSNEYSRDYSERDLNGEPILRDTKGNSERKIIDFGEPRTTNRNPLDIITNSLSNASVLNMNVNNEACTNQQNSVLDQVVLTKKKQKNKCRRVANGNVRV